MTRLSLLEGKAVDTLPVVLRDMLDPNRSIPVGVRFMPGRVPAAPWMYLVALVCAGMFTLMMLGTGISKVLAGGASRSELILFGLFSGVSFVGFVGCGLKWRRAVHQHQLLSTGLWRVGYYLIQEALMEYDGLNVWLFPRGSVARVVFSHTPSSGTYAHRISVCREDGTCASHGQLQYEDRAAMAPKRRILSFCG